MANTLRSVLEAAGIRPIKPSGLNPAVIAQSVAEYIATRLAQRVLTNFAFAEPEQSEAAREAGFDEYLIHMQVPFGTSHEELMAIYVRPAMTSLATELARLKGYLSFAQPSTLFKYPTEYALATRKHVHVRVALWHDQATDKIGCNITLLCLPSR